MSLRLLLPDPDACRADEPRRVRRGRTALDEWFGMDLMDDYIDTDCLPADHVLLPRDGRILERDHYVRDGRLVPGSVRHHLDQGHTLSLRNLQDVFPSFRRMCLAIQRETGYPCHANCYLTPPGARGLNWHWDPYTVVVAQVAGVKTWPLYRPVVTAPTREHLSFPMTTTSAALRERFEETEPDMTFVLEPGDTLWLPRGWIHHPHVTGPAPSLHITFALRELTRYWLAHQLVDCLLTDNRMREALSTNALTTGGLEGVVRETRTLLSRSLASLDPDQLARAVRNAMFTMPLTP
ncbi:JmjC domain-containing protein [Streptomyces pactum]|uniref:JmjC domain-containing protein n=1 Tax=Streptomyces pactum TaxID=68249 RepID=UPI0036F82600